MVENGLTDVFEYVNLENGEKRERTYKRGSTCIDSMSVTGGLLQHITGSEMIEYNEMIVSDHRGFLVDIDINTYLNVETCAIDDPTTICLNPRRLSHKKKFVKKAEELIDDVKLEQTMKEIVENGVTNELIEYVDEEITHVLNSARKHAEGPKRNVPYSRKKIMLMSALRYWRSRRSVIKGGKCDKDVMEKRRLDAKITVEENMTADEIDMQLQCAVNEWKNFKR